jgi:hypothetical protein
MKMFAQELVYRFQPNEIRYDSSGAGRWIDSILNNLCENVHAINFGIQSDKGYATMRAKLYYQCYERLTSPLAVHCDDASLTELKSDLLAHSLIDGDKSAINITKKDDVKKAIGRSPDLGDAFVLAMLVTTPKSVYSNDGYFD